MLPHPLALQRALRPLKRRVPSPSGRELDEEATAHRIAALGAHPEWWLPVLRPTPERWLSLNLVYDTGPTMPVWRPLIRELHEALTQSGIFRTVHTYAAGPDGTVRHGRSPAPTVPADGRTVTLLVSDCMGPQWWAGAAATRWYGTVRGWADRMPVAVVQPLPERLWSTTALPTTPGLLTAPGPAAPAAALTFEPYDHEPHPAPDTAPLPVLEPSSTWLSHWSSLVGDPGGTPLPGAAARLPRHPMPQPPDGRPRDDVTRLSAEDLVLRFRSAASPEAFRLAGHVAVGAPHLPVMRLVQAAVEERPRPQHLAEVILSGMLVSEPDGPAGAYAFRDGVRELLLGTLPRTAHGRTAELLTRAGALIDARAGRAAGEIRAVARGFGGGVGAPGTNASEGAGMPGSGGDVIAEVTPDTLRRLAGAADGPESHLFAGRYRLVEEVGPRGWVWRARDEEDGGETVAVKLYPEYAGARIPDSMDAARALSRFHHRCVVGIRDYGVNGGTPYVVMDWFEGTSLRTWLAGDRGGVVADMVLGVGSQLARTLMALHAEGLVHGALTASNVLIGRGGPMLSGFSLGTHDTATRKADLEALGILVLEMCSGGTDAPRDPVHTEDLDSLPPELRPELRSVINDLLSGSQSLQLRGADRLGTLGGPDPLPGRGRRYELLGPVLVSLHGQSLAVGPPQQQAMLCALLLAKGRALTLDELTRAVWGRSVPMSDHLMLGTYAAHLRRDCVGDEALVGSQAQGYALHLEDGTLDLNELDELREAATAARTAGDLARARDLTRSALDLWRGDALSGVPGPAAEAERTRRHEQRLSLYEVRAELDLELGEFTRAEADLSALCREYPSHGAFPRLLRRARSGKLPAGAGLPDPEDLERGCVVFESADAEAVPDALRMLAVRIRRFLGELGLPHDQYELLESPTGHTVLIEPGVSLDLFLAAVLDDLPTVLPQWPGPLRLLVTFWHTVREQRRSGEDIPRRLRTALEASSAPGIVAVSAGVHHRLAASPLTGLPSFLPLGDGAVCWYRLIGADAGAGVRADARGRRPVTGPVRTPATALGRFSDSGSTARVFALPDGRYTLPGSALDREASAHDRSSWQLYFVDLTTTLTRLSLALPSADRAGGFACEAELTWQVDDPVTVVRDAVRDVPGWLRQQFRAAARRVTRGFPAARTKAAEDALHSALREWTVPGFSVSCSVRLSRRTAPTGPDPALTDLLAGADAVILGFDGPVVPLYSKDAAVEAARVLVTLVTESRDPDDALVGTPLLRDGRTSPNPMDVLRAFADHRVGRQLLRRLDAIEAQAIFTARPAPGLTEFLGALRERDRTVAVAADNSPAVMEEFLRRRDLTDAFPGGVHGRPDDPRLLTPYPYALTRALDSLGTPTDRCVVIGSTPAEAAAARAVGLPFIGYAPAPDAARRLTADGVDDIVGRLAELTDAVRTP